MKHIGTVGVSTVLIQKAQCEIIAVEVFLHHSRCLLARQLTIGTVNYVQHRRVPVAIVVLAQQQTVAAEEQIAHQCELRV